MTDSTYRVDRRLLTGDWPLLVAWVADLLFGLWTWGRMPAQVPIHFSVAGQPDNWGPAWLNALMPTLVAALIYLGFVYLPLIDPRRRNYALFPETLRVMRWGLVLFFLIIHVVVVLYSLGYPVDVSLVVRLVIPALLVLIGNLFGRIRHNYFLGLRTPWTLADEQVWNRTHRVAGRLWVACGLLQMVAALLPPVAGAVVFFILLLAMALYPFYLSYRLFQAAHRRT